MPCMCGAVDCPSCGGGPFWPDQEPDEAEVDQPDGEDDEFFRDDSCDHFGAYDDWKN